MTHPELPDLLKSVADDNLHITIETSGIRFVPDLPCTLMSILKYFLASELNPSSRER